MNAKKMILVLLIAGVAAAGVFASGNKEEQTRPVPPRPRGQAPGLSEETVTVTGRLYFENRIHPELESGGVVYELLVPRFYAYDLDLEEGQTITVEGNMVEDMPCCEELEDEQQLRIFVTRAVIDGEEYDLEAEGRGPRRGMMGPDGRPGRPARR